MLTKKKGRQPGFYLKTAKVRVFLTTCLITAMSFLGFGAQKEGSDRILGKWISSQGNVIVEVFKEINTFKGRVVWFEDTDDRTRPMNVRKDQNNPNAALRDRKILGMEVLKNLTYNKKLNRWENGKIYDSRSGREWSSSIWLTKDGLMKVKGFWHFEFIGKTITFRRV